MMTTHRGGTVVNRILALCLLAFAAGLMLCTGAGAQDEGADGTTSVIATEADAGSDAAITRRLEAILAEIDGLQEVDVTVADGVVRLTGVVLNPELADSAAAIARRIEGVVVVENRIEGETAIVPRLQPVVDRLTGRLGEFVRFLPLLALGLLVLALFWIAGGIVVRQERLFERLSPNPFIADMWRQAVFLGFVLAGGLIAADVMGATALIGSLLGAAGLVGLAIGFAVRDTIENYIATILLSLRQPFAAMDMVAIDGTEGTVARLSSRATILITAEGNHVRIPNATVFKAVIVNYTRNPERRLEFKVGVDPDGDLTRAILTAQQALAAMDGILTDPPPLATIEQLGDFAVILSVSAWVDQGSSDFVKARSEAIRRVKEAYDGAGIAMPFPTYNVLRAEPTQAPEQRAHAGSTPVLPAAGEALDTSPDYVVEEKAAEERKGADNLLSESAAQE